MASKEILDITISNDEGKYTDGVMHYTAYTSGDRTSRAIIALTACLAGAGITLFIPIAHFFLVPAFLIAGPVLFVLRIKQHEAKENVEGSCPSCNEKISITLENTDQLPKRTYCPACDKAIELAEKA